MTEPTPADLARAREIAWCDCPGGGDGIHEPRGHTDECLSHLRPAIAQALADVRERCAVVADTHSPPDHNIATAIRTDEQTPGE